MLPAGSKDAVCLNGLGSSVAACSTATFLYRSVVSAESGPTPIKREPLDRLTTTHDISFQLAGSQAEAALLPFEVRATLCQ